jgi:hypothetical protein
MEILTMVEEEIEAIAVDDDQLVSAKSLANDNGRRWKFILPARYLVAIIIFYIVNVVKIYFVLSHVDSTVVVPTIYDVGFLFYRQ